MHRPPPSASSFLINAFGGLCYLAAVSLYNKFAVSPDEFVVPFIGIAAAVVPIILAEVLILKVHKRPHLGLTKAGPANRERASVKLLGFYTTLLLVMLLYAVVPLYWDSFYNYFHLFAAVVIVPVMISGWLYIPEIDRRMENPEDGLWHFGNAVRGRWKESDRRVVFSYLKSVALRFFFIPVMFVYFMSNLSEMMEGLGVLADKEIAASGYTQHIGMVKMILIAYFFFSGLDVLFATIGYVFTFRALDTHVRSTEPTLLGWIVCLICYYPFWEKAMIPLLFAAFFANPQWNIWFQDNPTLLTIWGMLSVLAICLESSATMTFGLRFSNLTYRGLITTGGFRFTKHPQYIAKMFNRFFVFVPFLSPTGFAGAAETLTMFCGICFIYYLRARTEENHLSRYPEYVAYAYWINEHGIFRFMAKLLPFLKYSEDRAKTGKLF